MNKLKNFLLLFLFALVSIIIVKGWYIGQELIISSDLTFPLRPVYYFINQLIYQWLPGLNGGIPHTVAPSLIIYHGFVALLSLVIKNISEVQLIHYSFWLFLPALTFFLLANYLFDKENRKKLFLFFAILFYSLNLYRVIMFGDASHMSIYAAEPLILLFTIRAINENKNYFKYSIFIALSSIIASGAGANPPMYAVFLLPPVLYILLVLVESFFQRKFLPKLYSMLKFTLLAAVISLLVNLYWLLPFLNKYFSVAFLGSLSRINLSDWGVGVSGITSITNIIRMQGAWDWYSGFGGDSYVPYAANYQNNPVLLSLGFLLPILAFSAIYFIRNRYTVFFTLVTLIGIIFSQGSHPPFGPVFDWMTQNVPLFWMFRSSWYKFSFLVALGYSFLGALSVVYIFDYIKNHKVKLFDLKTAYLFLAVVTVGTLIYAYPLITGEKFVKPGVYKFLPASHVNIPDYVFKSANWINSQSEGFRTFLFPSTPAFIYKWQFNGITDITFYLFNKNQAYTTNLISAIDKVSGIGALTSQIYDGVYKNNFENALVISGVLGSRYLIQRDDIRYDFYGGYDSPEFVNNQLKSVQELSLVKTFGEWNFYKLSDKYFLPLFYVPENLIFADSGTSSLGDILTLNEASRQQVLFSDFTNNRDNNGVKKLANDYVTKASCVLCSDSDLSGIENKIQIPFVQLLPDSPFYSLVENREKKQLALLKALPNESIDLDLNLSNKRLAEISKILERSQKDNSEGLIKNVILRYQNFVEDALTKTNNLSGVQRNENLIKILAYIKVQGNFLLSVNNPNNISQSSLNNLAIFLNDTFEKVMSDIWMTSEATDKKLLVSLNEDGAYNLVIKNSPSFPSKILIDGKEYITFNNIVLNKGTHKAELIYTQSENPLDKSSVLLDGDYVLNFGEKQTFGIKNFDYKNNYSIKFEYKVSEGKAPNIMIAQDNDQKDWDGSIARKVNSLLNGDGKWHTFKYALTPNLGAKNAYIEFYSSGFDFSQRVITIKNFTISNSFVPQLYLVKNVKSVYGSIPNITFLKINPTEYKVHIENAQEPFILNFGENYDVGWKAYVIQSKNSKVKNQKENVVASYFGGQIKELESKNKFIDDNFITTVFLKPVPEENHLKTNGYANGWLIDKKGNYDIIIEYWPQRLFYLGIIVSGLSIAVLSVFLVIIRIKK